MQDNGDLLINNLLLVSMWYMYQLPISQRKHEDFTLDSADKNYNVCLVFNQAFPAKSWFAVLSMLR